jgi:transposase
VDETTLTLDPPLRACWMKVGQQKRHIFGGYNWLKDRVVRTVSMTKNSAAFIVFLEELLIRRYPGKKLILVMDNAAYHKSASALAALSLFEDRVIVIWLPPYCSDLNPIERFWRYLKDKACANKLQGNIDEVVRAAEKIMVTQNSLISDLKFHVSKNI